ncbi:hypothetical protein ADUPG1_013384 [Aduncisulcus paluster]|uniref:Uncharacterized protein n=1 Tax=Aduncisulcus paluster TaxID=2918883 RepID=A0ABQ5K2S3_9EUKA|nr:hypothetical protein ADUPG1_013384 [Aduncisulcus paluster]
MSDIEEDVSIWGLGKTTFFTILITIPSLFSIVGIVRAVQTSIWWIGLITPIIFAMLGLLYGLVAAAAISPAIGLIFRTFTVLNYSMILSVLIGFVLSCIIVFFPLLSDSGLLKSVQDSISANLEDVRALSPKEVEKAAKTILKPNSVK